MRIRDPIHGTLFVEPEETAVLDSPQFQRLRHVRQLGFGDLAFPGATHTRHAHCLGAMHVASRMFEQICLRADLSEEAKVRFRATVRLAVLCHDLGHMPLSHASERIAPARRLLALPEWLGAPEDPDALASHEDYTAKLLLDSSLADVIRSRFGAIGVTPERVVSLISGAQPPGGDGFVDRGVDWGPLLRAIVSGEMDADRMDYLIRDSVFTGVTYGRYDLDWIVLNVLPAVRDGKAYLALPRSAAFAFEDFLLSRYQMFLAVYYHHTSVNFDYMLRRYCEETPGELEIPADPDAFLACDDGALFHTLRRSQNGWARRIVNRRGYKLLVQFTERDEGYDLETLVGALEDAGVDHFSVESRGVLSRYFEEKGETTLFIADPLTERFTEVTRYSPLYRRYRSAVRLSRLYVLPEQLDRARTIYRAAVPAGRGSA